MPIIKPKQDSEIMVLSMWRDGGYYDVPAVYKGEALSGPKKGMAVVAIDGINIFTNHDRLMPLSQYWEEFRGDKQFTNIIASGRPWGHDYADPERYSGYN